MPRALRAISPIAIGILAVSFALLRAPVAAASANQEAIFQADSQLRANAPATLAELRGLGVQRIRMFVTWSSIAPSPNSSHKPRNFNAADPASYPAANWTALDTVVKDAKADGIGVYLTLTGPAPIWATPSGVPRGHPRGVWKPFASEYGKFVQAIGTRYSGRYNGLPAVRYWGIWNEPNFGPDLSPQENHKIGAELSPAIYRGLLDAAWSALHATGHGRDTILFGELAPRGITTGGNPGMFGGMVPLRFLLALYCVNSSYVPYRGSAAAARGCPTNSAGSRRFRAAHPALFQATGFADHPYPQGLNPTLHTWPNPGPDQYADMPQLPALERLLDRANRVYGSHTRFSIYSTEYGYRTNPPDLGLPSFATAAVWLNWAEYLSWRNPRLVTYFQYGLVDPPGGNFPSALETRTGRHKATYDAFRLPLFLPVTSTRRGRRLEVWGDVRPAHEFSAPQQGLIEFQRGSRGKFTVVKAVSVKGRGYFDVRITFPASGSVRLAWMGGAKPYDSRTQKITIH